jgi:hypothetical protein
LWNFKVALQVTFHTSRVDERGLLSVTAELLVFKFDGFVVVVDGCALDLVGCCVTDVDVDGAICVGFEDEEAIGILSALLLIGCGVTVDGTI